MQTAMLDSLQTIACCTEMLIINLIQNCYKKIWQTWRIEKRHGRWSSTQKNVTKKIPLKLNYKLHNHTLQPADNRKYLGVTISNDLDINNITSKANKTLGFLRRNMKNCTRKVKYTSLVRPVVEYSSPVWNPSKKQQISQVEQIQRKAAWYVFNDYRDRSPGVVTNMIDTLQWDSLACRRTKASLILLYKINGGLVVVPTTMLSQSDRRTRGAHKFRQIQSNKDFYKYSFFRCLLDSPKVHYSGGSLVRRFVSPKVR
jgi:hypothetical protein